MTEREALEQSLAELETQVRKHQQIVQSVIEKTPPENGCIWTECHHQQVLLNLLVETIQVIDETRKSFKSKQLELLRKRLLQVMTDETRCAHSQNRLVHLGG
jgi:hypothetical protein